MPACPAFSESDPTPGRVCPDRAGPTRATGRPGAARGIACLLAAVLAAGCASPPTLRTEVTRFHRWEAAEPRTVAFRRETPSAQTLESRSYERLVAEQLVALGFTEADVPGARFQVAFGYRATPEPRRVTEYWQPGGFGVGGGSWSGPWLGPRVGLPFPYGRFDPLWSMPPVPMARDITVWRHELTLDLYDMRADAPAGRKVYEARAIAVADSEAMPRLMPGLVVSALADFPGTSGETRRLEVALPVPAPAPAPAPASGPASGPAAAPVPASGSAPGSAPASGPAPGSAPGSAPAPVPAPASAPVPAPAPAR
jgi:hypothetical protein